LKDPALRVALASLHERDDAPIRERLDALGKRPVVVAAPRDVAATRLHAAGYLLLNGQAVHIDAAERLAAAAATLAHQGPFVATPALSRASGLPQAMLPAVLKGLGYAVADGTATGANGGAFTRARKRPRRAGRDKPR